jgi:hypothetical protein
MAFFTSESLDGALLRAVTSFGLYTLVMSTGHRPVRLESERGWLCRVFGLAHSGPYVQGPVDHKAYRYAKW